MRHLQIPLFNKKSGAKSSAPSECPSEDESTSEPELNLPASKTKKQKSKKTSKRASSTAVPSTRKQPWPKSLPERAKAIESFLRGFSTPVTPAQLAACFRKPRYDNLPEIQEILETLCTFGRARHGSEKNTYSA